MSSRPSRLTTQIVDALVLVQPVLDVRGEAIDLAGHRLVDVDLVDQVQTALEVEPQLDPLLEMLLNESRLLVLRDDRRDQIEDGQHGDEPVEGRLPPPRSFHEIACPFVVRRASSYDALASDLSASAGRVPRVDAGDGAAEESDADALLHLQRHLVVLDAGDPADDPALGGDVVPLLQLRQHLLVILGLLGLRAQHQEVEDCEDRDEGNELRQRRTAPTGSSLRQTI